ncbi:MAG: glycosyltransferase [Ferruginibacter sp.]|nr:glycosyltransferase [Ferruginibacter sp.]
MISVIICSINKKLCEQVLSNINETIGTAWEAIVKDNMLEKKSITQVYNEAAQAARYDICCFVHEDVLFKTKDWGKKLIREFELDDQLGLIGIGGSKYKSELPSGWFTGIRELDCCNIEHQDKTGKQTQIYLNPDPAKQLQEVAVIDGVFMCCPKNVWEKIQFDEQMLTGFHLYDIDFSFKVAQQYKVAVTFRIDMVHFTEGGNYGDEWIKYTLTWHEKMKHQLPFRTTDTKSETRKFNKIIVRNWLIRLKHENIHLLNKLSWLYFTTVYKLPDTWPNLPMFFFKQLFNGNRR